MREISDNTPVNSLTGRTSTDGDYDRNGLDEPMNTKQQSRKLEMRPNVFDAEC